MEKIFWKPPFTNKVDGLSVISSYREAGLPINEKEKAKLSLRFCGEDGASFDYAQDKLLAPKMKKAKLSHRFCGEDGARTHDLMAASHAL